MKITHCKLNHLVNPLGYTLPRASSSAMIYFAAAELFLVGRGRPRYKADRRAAYHCR